MAKLSNIQTVGTYTDTETGKSLKIKMGRNMQRGTDVVFYNENRKRIILSDKEFYSSYKRNEK